MCRICGFGAQRRQAVPKHREHVHTARERRAQTKLKLKKINTLTHSDAGREACGTRQETKRERHVYYIIMRFTAKYA